ncbi:hypothetical protein DQG13_19525 [Paenibacillus sp. YN15]|nr:hypothetical protein DQG13_19525 [Paenibacillus sp. YN15]
MHHSPSRAYTMIRAEVCTDSYSAAGGIMGYYYLFSYGTFIDREVQHILFGRNVTVGAAVLPGYSRFAAEDGYYYVLPAPGCCVKGELLCLSADDLVVADLWEDVPKYVRALKTVLRENGTAVTAYVYCRSNPQARKPAPPGTLAAIPRSRVIAAAKELAAELSPGDRR